MTRMTTGLVVLAAGLALALPLAAPSPAQAQAWPQRPVRFILPLGPGAGVDIASRMLAERLSAKWGQSVVIENKPGGDGILGISAFIGARDDHVLDRPDGIEAGFLGRLRQLDRRRPVGVLAQARVAQSEFHAVTQPYQRWLGEGPSSRYAIFMRVR